MTDWFRSTPESEALLAQETLVLDATEIVYEAMEIRGINGRELADRLGVRPSEVSQRLSGRRNLTLRSLAAMLHQLGAHAELHLVMHTGETVAANATGAQSSFQPAHKPTDGHVAVPALETAIQPVIIRDGGRYLSSNSGNSGFRAFKGPIREGKLTFGGSSPASFSTNSGASNDLTRNNFRTFASAK